MENISRQIALVLKALRRERGWSLDRAAQETGVSKAMLGQIEREESSPTVTTLWKIAGGFNTAFSSFLEVDAATKLPTQYSGLLEDVSLNDKKFIFTPIFPFDPEINCEIFIIELSPNCEHLSVPHQPGVIEHVIVIEGAIEVLVEGVWKKLVKDEGLRFNADQHHGYRNMATVPARFHNMIHYSTKY